MTDFFTINFLIKEKPKEKKSIFLSIILRTSPNTTSSITNTQIQQKLKGSMKSKQLKLSVIIMLLLVLSFFTQGVLKFWQPKWPTIEAVTAVKRNVAQ